MFDDVYWMKLALLAAKKGEKKGEVPIGSIIVYKNKLIGTGWNSCISQKNPTAHAEIISIQKAGQKLNNYRLKNTVLYVTHEPCWMCASAIMFARISRIVYGSYSSKYDCITNFVNILYKKNIKHHIVNITSGILLYECSILLSDFFKNKRKKINFVN
ncbi:tRNA-specific adenosine deaminase [Buchnera aphidicola (Cinara tujafilina)]|uniref:tRNA-specific adenosine deaminase n=1 Tax=Buchnera aphidicola (Cinara tujafilina) TaxID=261317 RepID=F7WZT8_9GAMM|nr:tRNA adenosine(34) deaminase TadA [Buchnera aphidicola]AEH39750.1 tRNA-specific adenosine deaminase [Buchnera aphidicola (Cinara tujafilina)]